MTASSGQTGQGLWCQVDTIREQCYNEGGTDQALSLQGLLEDIHAERAAKEAEEIPEVDEHGKKLTKKQQAAAKKAAEAERTRQTQDEGTRIDPKVLMKCSVTPEQLHRCQAVTRQPPLLRLPLHVLSPILLTLMCL